MPSSQDRRVWRRGKGIQGLLVNVDSLPLASDFVRGSAGNDTGTLGSDRARGEGRQRPHAAMNSFHFFTM
jgi:hypothetical protein